MKLIVLALLAAALVGGPVLAQNPAQISRGENSNCPGCNLFQADYSNREMKGRNFAGARLRQSDLSLSVMNRTSFARSDLRDVNAYGGVFSSANFSGADLTNATFVGAYLEGSNFAGARMAGANFSGAEMSKVAGLSQAQLNTACGDSSTLLPRGMVIPVCR